MFIFLILSSLVSAYHPVLCLHGVTSDYRGCDTMGRVVTEQHPNTTFEALKFNGNVRSLKGLQKQLEALKPFVENIVSNNPVYKDGFHLVCHSQGALLCRCLTQYWTGHNIRRLVSLAGPQAGVYGVEFLTDNVPFTKNIPNIDEIVLDHIYDIFDLPAFQEYLSVADMWHDPYHMDDFLERNHFLPVMNNLVSHNDSQTFKMNFVSLDMAVFYTGDMGVGDLYDDGISPWQTGAWGFWDANSNMTNMTETKIWTEDTIGLRKLDEAGRLHVESVKGIRHNTWMLDESTIIEYVLPWLD